MMEELCSLLFRKQQNADRLVKFLQTMAQD